MNKFAPCSIAVALLAACSGGDSPSPAMQAKIALTVKSTTGTSVSNVAVAIDGQRALTGADGTAELRVSPDYTGTASLTKPGYLIKQLDVEALGADSSAHYTVTVKALERVAEGVDFSAASTDNPVRIADTSTGAAVTIDSNNAFVNGDNQPHTGPVDVYITPIDVSDGSDERDAFPGEYRGIGADQDEAETILSYGMADYRFTDSHGGALQLAEGVRASIDIPIFHPQVSTFAALAPGEAVPIWYYDDSRAVWVENNLGEGEVVSAEIDGESRLLLRGQVDHFTPWNADVAGRYYSWITTRVWCDAGQANEAISATVRVDASGFSRSYGVRQGERVRVPAPAGEVCISLQSVENANCNPPAEKPYAPVCKRIPDGQSAGPLTFFDLLP